MFIHGFNQILIKYVNVTQNIREGTVSPQNIHFAPFKITIMCLTKIKFTKISIHRGFNTSMSKYIHYDFIFIKNSII